MLIDYQITQASIRKDKTYFIEHPSSHKKVYVMCPACGIFRWTEYRLSHKLCRACSLIRNDKNE